MSAKTILEQAVSLDLDERLKLLHDIWATIRSDAEHQPLTPEERADLRDRLKEHQANPDDGIYWEDAKAKLRSRK